MLVQDPIRSDRPRTTRERTHGRAEGRPARYGRRAAALAVLVLPLVFVLGGCGGSGKAAVTPDPYQIGPLPSSSQIAALNRAGSWQRTSATTVSFDGTIGAGSAKGFTAALTPTTTTVEVASPGGNATEALAVAETIRQRGLALDVKVVCVGPCADYWFTAAKARTTEPGSWLGFTPDLGYTPDAASNPTAADAQQGASGASLADAQNAVARESALFSAAGVNIDTFHSALKTALVTPPGLPTASPVQVWIPTKTELAGLGLTGLEQVRTPVTLAGANADAQAWGVVARYEDTVVGLTAPATSSGRPTAKALSVTGAR